MDAFVAIEHRVRNLIPNLEMTMPAIISDLGQSLIPEGEGCTVNLIFDDGRELSLYAHVDEIEEFLGLSSVPLSAPRYSPSAANVTPVESPVPASS